MRTGRASGEERREPSRGVEFALARRRARYEDEVARLLEATLTVMRLRETADPTVNDILVRAGLSTSVFYRHFPTKDDLLVAVLEQAHELTASHLRQRLATVDDPVERIDLWVRAIFDLVRTGESLAANRALLLAHPRLLQHFPDEINRGFAELARPLESAVADARRAAGLRTGDPSMDSRLALHQVFAILVDAAALGTPPEPAVVDGVVAYTLRAAISPPVSLPRRARRRRPPRP